MQGDGIPNDDNSTIVYHWPPIGQKVEDYPTLSSRRPAEISAHGSVPRSAGRPTDFPDLRVDGFESTRDVTGKAFKQKDTKRDINKCWPKDVQYNRYLDVKSMRLLWNIVVNHSTIWNRVGHLESFLWSWWNGKSPSRAFTSHLGWSLTRWAIQLEVGNHFMAKWWSVPASTPGIHTDVSQGCLAELQIESRSHLVLHAGWPQNLDAQIADWHAHV